MTKTGGDCGDGGDTEGCGGNDGVGHEQAGDMLAPGSNSLLLENSGPAHTQQQHPSLKKADYRLGWGHISLGSCG